MSVRINSAYRVLSILEKVKEEGGKEKVSDMWISVFEIDIDDRNKQNFEISRCLEQLDKEVEIIREQMAETDFEANLYEPWLRIINNILGFHLLDRECQSVKNTISREVLLCLGFCKQILPDEESLIEDDDINELLELLNSLESTLAISTLPTFTRNIIRSNVENIKSALRNYDIVGAKALKSAMTSAFGEVVTNDTALSEAKDSEEFNKFGQLMQKLHLVTEKVIKTEKVFSAGVKLGQYGVKALEYFDKLSTNI